MSTIELGFFWKLEQHTHAIPARASSGMVFVSRIMADWLLLLGLTSSSRMNSLKTALCAGRLGLSNYTYRRSRGFVSAGLGECDMSRACLTLRWTGIPNPHRPSDSTLCEHCGNKSIRSWSVTSWPTWCGFPFETSEDERCDVISLCMW